jgi:transposase
MIIRAKITRYKIKKIMQFFCTDIDATKTALLMGINRKTVNRYFLMFRQIIYDVQQQEKNRFVGTVECDESYFGGKRKRGVPGKRGRGTDKQPVFGIFQHEGRVHTEIIPDCSANTLQKIVRGHVAVETIVHTDKWRGYDGLVDVGYDKHFRVNHSKHFSENGVHINGIESFWSFTKRRLAKFNGVKPYFPLHLKECEWRWNKSSHTLLKELTHFITKKIPVLV